MNTETIRSTADDLAEASAVDAELDDRTRR